MKAICLDVFYEEGDFYLTQGVKKGTRTTYKNGYTHSPRGSGWGENYKPSHLVLTIEVKGKVVDTWIDRYFKDNVGKLTKKRRNKIIDTMPYKVEVEEYEKQDGSSYYVVDEDDLEKWAKRAKLI